MHRVYSEPYDDHEFPDLDTTSSLLEDDLIKVDKRRTWVGDADIVLDPSL